MSRKPKILFFAGSTRRDSFSKKLAKAAAAMATDAEAVFVDLKDYEMPLYNGDDEAESGVPEAARRFRKLFMEADGFFIASAEYNASYTPLLKNTLDWISRADGDVPGLAAYRGKVGAIVSSSPGMLGGLRGLFHLRDVLVSTGALIVSSQYALGTAHEAFDDQGNIIVERHSKGVKAVVDELVRVLKMANV